MIASITVLMRFALFPPQTLDIRMHSDGVEVLADKVLPFMPELSSVVLRPSGSTTHSTVKQEGDRVFDNEDPTRRSFRVVLGD